MWLHMELEIVMVFRLYSLDVTDMYYPDLSYATVGRFLFQI